MTRPTDEHDVPSAAAVLGLSVHAVRRLLRARQLGHARRGPNRGRIVITDADIARYRASCRVEPIAAPQPVEAPPARPVTSLAHLPGAGHFQ